MLEEDQIHTLNYLLTDAILTGHMNSQISLNKKPRIFEHISQILFFLLYNFLVRHIEILSYLLFYHHTCIGC